MINFTRVCVSCFARCQIKLFFNNPTLSFSLSSMERLFQPLVNSPCAYCTLKQAPQTDIPRQRCTRCKAVYYCSKTCQTAHWTEGHRKDCCELEPYAEFISRASSVCGVFCIDTESVYPYPFGLTAEGVRQQEVEQRTTNIIVIEENLFLFDPYKPGQQVILTWDHYPIRLANSVFSISTAEQIVVWTYLQRMKRVRDHAAGLGFVAALLSTASNKLLKKSKKGQMYRIHAAFTHDFYSPGVSSYTRLERGDTGEWMLDGKILQDESLLRPGDPLLFFASDLRVAASCIGDIIQADVFSAGTLAGMGSWDLVVIAFTDVPGCESIGLPMAQEAAKTGAPVLCIDANIPGIALSCETHAFLAAHFKDAGLVFPAIPFDISGVLARCEKIEYAFSRYDLTCKLLLPFKK